MGTIFDVVKLDPRPTFIVDLREPSITNALFSTSQFNDALLACSGLADSLISINDTSYSFRDWILDEASSSARGVYSFHGMGWIQFAPNQRYKVVSALSPTSRCGKRPLGHLSHQCDLSAVNKKSTKTAAIYARNEPVEDFAIKTKGDEPPHLKDGWSNKYHKLLRAVMKEGRIAEMARIGMFEFLPSGKLLHANDNWYESSGHPRDPKEATEFSFMECVFEDDKELAMQKWDTLISGIPVTYEMRWKKSTNAQETNSLTEGDACGVTWICAACVPVLAEDGTLSSISGFTTDISVQKKVEQHKLERADAIERAEVSEKRFARFAELAPIGVWVLDCDYQITYGNDMYFKILGSPRVEYKDVRWADWVLEEDVPQILDGLRRLTEEKVKMNFEFRLKRPFNGGEGIEGETWISASGYPDFHEDGTIKEILGVMSEISRYKWAENAQKRRVEDALESKRQQESFIDMTSHEIRNPINAVVQSADLTATSLIEMLTVLKPNNENEPINADRLIKIVESSLESVQTIIACSLHQKRVVDDILMVSKLDSKLLLIAPSKVQPVAVTNDSLRMLEAEARVADVRLHYIEDQSLANLGINWVVMDSSRVLQIFMNLLTNAIKFTRTQPKRDVFVTIKASSEKPSKEEGYIPAKINIKDLPESSEWEGSDLIYLHFVVRDTGRGLTSDEKARIFSKFVQASRRTYVEYGGSGLGLFVSRELAELLGGQIRVESEFGHGSTFAFYIKCRKVEETRHLMMNAESHIGIANHASNVTQADKVSLAGYHVLLVEDNLVNQRVLTKQLEKLDCEVTVAGHGLEALALIQRSKWYHGKEHTGNELDVVLLDLEMPVMGGLEYLRRIRAMEADGEIVAHLPVIVVTANARKKQVEQAEDAGMDGYISKPFRVGELVPKILSFDRRSSGMEEDMKMA